MKKLAFLQLQAVVVLAMILLIVFVIGLQAMMNSAKVENLIGSVTATRTQVALSSIESSIKRAEELGLSASKIDNLDDVMARASAQDDDIDDIIMINLLGQIVAGPQITLSDADWTRLVRRVVNSNEDQSMLRLDDRLYVGRKLYDIGGSLQGGLMAVVDFTANGSTIGTVQSRLLTFAAVLVAVMAGIMVLVVAFHFRFLNVIINRLAFLNQIGDAPPLPETDPVVQRNPLLVNFEAARIQAQSRLAQVRDQIDSLSQEAQRHEK